MSPQHISCKQALFGLNLTYLALLWPWKLGQGHQNLSKSSNAQMLYPCKFGSNLPTSAGDILHTSVMPTPMLTLTLTRQYVAVFRPYHAKPGPRL